MRLYVIGPVTGRENLNRKAFEDAKEKLWDAGYDVLIPHDVVLPIATHEQAMRLSIKTMLGCDGVVVLPDWEGSKGAKLEHDVAIACGLHVHNFLIWMNRASSWAHRSPDYSDDDSSPEETQNTPSDGVAAPSNEALGALTRRMDETNALLRAVSHQIAALVSIGTGELTKSTCDYPKEVVNMTLGMASDCLRASKVCFESAEKENQDGKA